LTSARMFAIREVDLGDDESWGGDASRRTSRFLLWCQRRRTWRRHQLALSHRHGSASAIWFDRRQVTSGGHSALGRWRSSLRFGTRGAASFGWRSLGPRSLRLSSEIYRPSAGGPIASEKPTFNISVLAITKATPNCAGGMSTRGGIGGSMGCCSHERPRVA
jgi:hypothetical protein